MRDDAKHYAGTKPKEVSPRGETFDALFYAALRKRYISVPELSRLLQAGGEA